MSLSEQADIIGLVKQVEELKAQLAAARVRLQKTMPCYAPKKAIRGRLERETNETRRACLEHALARVERHESLIIALSEQATNV